MINTTRVAGITLLQKEEKLHLRLKWPGDGAVKKVHLSWA